MPIDLPPLPPPEPGYERAASGLIKPKQSSFLPTFGAGVGLLTPKKKPELVYLGVVSSAAYDVFDYYFNNRPLGDEAPDRHIVVAVVIDSYWGVPYGEPQWINWVTINGTSMTVRANNRDANGYSASGIWSLHYPTGTSANIRVNVSQGDQLGCVVGMWAIYNLRSHTPTGANSYNYTSPLASVASQPGGVAIGVTADQDNLSSNFAGMTERYDFVFNSYSATACAADKIDIPGTTFSSQVTNYSGWGCSALVAWR